MRDAPASGNSTLRNDMGDPGRDMVLSLTHGRILYWRNMILLFLSIVVAGRTLLALCRTWRHTQYDSVKRFANLMVGILLLIELAQSIVWIIGINIASAQDGVGPWKRISLERADKLCYGDAILDYFWDIMIYGWHAVMAFLIWEWIVRQKDMDLLTRRLWYLLPTCIVVAVAMTTVPIVHRNLGLWPHSDCFIRRSWKTPHTPMLGVLLDRMVMLPLCWLVVVLFTCATVHFLRREALQQYGGVRSIMRLQMRLVLITTVFALVWILQSIPLYLDRRSFALEFGTKWAFGIGFADALIYGWPTSLTYLFGPCCLPLIKRLLSSFSRGGNDREPQQGAQEAGRSRWLPEVELRRSTSARWTTLIPSEYPTMFNDSSDSRSGAAAAVSGVFWGKSRPPHAAGLTPYRIFATTFDMNYRNLPSGKHADDCDGSRHTSGGRWDYDMGSTSERDPALIRGLEEWIPAGQLYHLHVIAVQRCRVLTRLRQAIQDHLGGSGRYVLAGMTEIGDALYGKMALLVFARTVDVESGAFRLLASNQRPVVLREMRGGCKGMVGLSFRYYDTAFAVINAHLPATSVYPADRALEERDKHVSSMLQRLRIGGDHERWNAHLQYHHVVLMGNLNYRMRLGPHDMFNRIQTSSKMCQAAFESLRETAAQRGIGGTEWSWRGHGYNRLWSLADHQKQQGTRQGMTAMAGWDVGLEDLVGEDEHWSMLACPTEAWAWVKKKDVLSRRLQRGLLFSGFTEPNINFPPSFKWRVGATADDYTEGAVLEAAYVTGPQSYLPEVDRSSSSTTTVPAKWTPSYTDRILTRSLPAFASRLAVGAYDLCDHGPLTCISDHRAVAQALTVLIDPTYVLPKSEDLHEKGRAASSVQKCDSSSTAQAMAAAATRRQPHAGGGGSSAVPRPVPSSSSSSSKPFPLLMTLTLREFSFHLTGLEVTREEGEESVYGPLCPQDSMSDLRRSESDHDSVTSTHAVVMGFLEEEDGEANAQGGLGSSEEWDQEYEKKDENRTGDIEGPPLPSPPQSSFPTLPPLLPRPPFEFGTTSTSTGGWRRIPSSFKLWRGMSLSRGVSQATSHVSSVGGGDALGFVDHILILYPLPAEDPLLPLRRAQALGDSFGQGSSVQTRSTLLSGNRGQGSGTGVDRGASMGSSDCGSSSSSSGGTTVGTRKLENLHCIPWTRGLEYDATNLPFLHRDNSSSSSIFSPGTSSPAASRVIGGTPLSSQYASSDTKEDDGGTAARVNVLTMGPPRPCQHALIKFMGKRGKELGQGVFQVELQEGNCGRGPSLLGRSGGDRMFSERRRGRELVTRQTVELSVGGAYRGTVTFTVGVKARKRAEDGSSLRLPQ